MNDKNTSEFIQLRPDVIGNIAVEIWRLNGFVNNTLDINANPITRRTKRCMDDLLKHMEVEIIDFLGKEYDPGMAPEVIDVQLDDKHSSKIAEVVETVCPTVLWRGKVIVNGQIVVRRPLSDSESNKVVKE